MTKTLFRIKKLLIALFENRVIKVADVNKRLIKK